MLIYWPCPLQQRAGVGENQGWDKGWVGGEAALGTMVYCRDGGTLTLTLREWGGAGAVWHLFPARWITLSRH